MNCINIKIDLNNWQLRGEAINRGREDALRISELEAGWIDTPVPGDIRQGLIAAGLTTEPTLGMNSYEGQWIEDKSWWLRTTFIATKDMIVSDQAELVLDGLDANASIFLNGKLFGEHPTVFRPFVKRLNEVLVEGENVFLVRLTHGIENVTQQEVDDVGGEVITEVFNNNPDAGDRRRIYVRKPQYTWGWDWVARIATVGITVGASIQVFNKAKIRDVQTTPKRCNADDVQLQNVIEVEWFHRSQAGKVEVAVDVVDADGNSVDSSKAEVLVQGGINFIEIDSQINNAELWWPNGMGEQYRYGIAVSLYLDGEKVDSTTVKYGIRFVELDTDEKFAFKINGQTIFCKGANWIPCDALYGRVTDQRVEKLIDEAQKANFNMLRIWGGGLYEREAFYEACDQKGVMVWQDFMFACAPPPDHLEYFKDEIRKEADYQTKRLHKYASVVIWCGSNECLGTSMFPYQEKQTENGRVTFGDILPRAVRNNCPELPYWFNSPYGTSNNWNFKNTDGIGDCHFWHDAMMHPDMIKRITPEVFDTGCDCKFISEYGFVGPCSKETTAQYLDGAEMSRDGKVWQHHCNSFEKGTVDAAIDKHYANPENIEIDDYLYYGGLVQGLMYGYSLESLRAVDYCHGGLFWMYNDCWGEVGWTIIDYYLRRKISWYFVKRALAPLKLILRQKDDKVVVKFANDTQLPVTGELEYGYVSLDGKLLDVDRIQINLDKSVKNDVLSFSKKDYDSTKGLWFARVTNRDDIATATLRVVDFKQLEYNAPELEYSLKENGEGEYILSVSSETYAHGVEVMLPKGAVAEDNYFDIMPMTTYKVLILSNEKLKKEGISLRVCNEN